MRHIKKRNLKIFSPDGPRENVVRGPRGGSRRVWPHILAICYLLQCVRHSCTASSVASHIAYRLEKMKIPVLVIALLTQVRLVIESDLQPRKWQLIGMS